MKKRAQKEPMPLIIQVGIRCPLIWYSLRLFVWGVFIINSKNQLQHVLLFGVCVRMCMCYTYV